MGQTCSCKEGSLAQQADPPVEVQSVKVLETAEELVDIDAATAEPASPCSPLSPSPFSSQSQLVKTVSQTSSLPTFEAPLSADSDSKVLEEQFQTLLLAGRLVEAEQLAQAAEQSGRLGHLDAGLVAWVKETLVTLRHAASSAQPCEKDGWHCMPLSDLNMKVYIRRREFIDVRIVAELPGTLDQLLAINWEPDLAMQWLPFNPKVDMSKSANTSSVLMLVTAKLPVLAGTREVYVYRTVVDCVGDDAEVAGRRGLMIVEHSPENWRTGGTFQGEFTVLPPSTSRWVTRDEQRESVTFYEVVGPSTVRATITYQLVINIPRWLFPDAALHFLAKVTARQWHAGINRALSDFDRLGYTARLTAGAHQLYKGIASRMQR